MYLSKNKKGVELELVAQSDTLNKSIMNIVVNQNNELILLERDELA